MPENNAEAQPRVSAFKERLEQLGWIGGKNLHMEFRWAEDLSRIGTYAAELAGLTPDVILTTSTPTTKAVQQTTTTTPIVFVGVSDPMSTGIVASLAKPGGNTTGFANYEFAIGGKWLELLKEIAPHVKQAHVIVDPNNPTGSWHLQTIESAALAVGIAVTTVVVRNKDEIGPAFATFSKEREKGLIVLPGPVTNAHRNEIIASAMAHRIPAVYPFRFYTIKGGLVSSGVDTRDQYRRAAFYIDRILKSDKPADLPVQAPTTYEIVINLNTAKTLDITIPPALLARADEVIE